jgi:hypothetical protein
MNNIRDRNLDVRHRMIEDIVPLTYNIATCDVVHMAHTTSYVDIVRPDVQCRTCTLLLYYVVCLMYDMVRWQVSRWLSCKILLRPFSSLVNAGGLTQTGKTGHLWREATQHLCIPRASSSLKFDRIDEVKPSSASTKAFKRFSFVQKKL